MFVTYFSTFNPTRNAHVRGVAYVHVFMRIVIYARYYKYSLNTLSTVVDGFG